MKRKRWIIFGVTILVLATIYFVPIIVSSLKARPLYGDFDIGTKCMGGHEIFLHLGEEQCFEHCPGHRDFSQNGWMSRNENEVAVRALEGGEVFYRIVFDGKKHFIVNEKTSHREELKQVNNPWRTWLPTLLPEH